MGKKDKKKTGPGAASSAQYPLTDQDIKEITDILNIRLERQSRKKKSNEMTKKEKIEFYNKISRAIDELEEARKSRTEADAATSDGDHYQTAQAAIQGNNHALEREKAKLETEYGKLESQVSALKQKLDEKEQEVAALQQQAAESQAQIASLKREASKNDNVATLHQQGRNVQEVEQEASQLRGTVDELQSRVRELEQEVSDAKDALAQRPTNGEVAELKNEIKGLKEENNDLRRNLKRSENNVFSLENDVKKLEGKIVRLKADLQTATEPPLQDRRSRYAEIDSKPKGIKVILPQESHDDSRVKPVWRELMARLRRRQIELDVEVKVGKIIEQKDGLVILPVICASRVGSDIAAALEKANMKKEIKLVIIIFNHLAAHCSTIRVKTRERLSDRSVLERCTLMVDAVYWEGKMSDCKVNDELMSELGSLLKQK